MTHHRSLLDPGRKKGGRKMMRLEKIDFETKNKKESSDVSGGMCITYLV